MPKAPRNYRLQPRVIGRRGEPSRRLIVRDGYEYHVTKGWRKPINGVASNQETR